MSGKGFSLRPLSDDQRQFDPVVLAAVNDIEVLTSNLSRKIWQKIAILEVAGTGRD